MLKELLRGMFSLSIKKSPTASESATTIAETPTRHIFANEPIGMYDLNRGTIIPTNIGGEIILHRACLSRFFHNAKSDWWLVEGKTIGISDGSLNILLKSGRVKELPISD